MENKKSKITINPFIIGAGGVASYLLPVLVRSFDVQTMYLRDADILEERNLDRQLFNNDQIGQSKAEALLSLVENQGISRSHVHRARTNHGTGTKSERHGVGKEDGSPSEETPSSEKWKPQVGWFTDGEHPPKGCDLVICMADNHTARRAALHAAEESMIPCVIGGNEYYDSQAMWVDPMDYHTPLCPFERYPELETDTSMNPVRCQGEALISTPQLAIANMRCASHILDLMWLHLVVLPAAPESARKELLKSWPIEIYTSINKNEYIRHG